MYNTKKFKSCIYKEENFDTCIISSKYKIIECSITYNVKNYTICIEFRYNNIIKKYIIKNTTSLGVNTFIEYTNDKINIQYIKGIYDYKMINCNVSGYSIRSSSINVDGGKINGHEYIDDIDGNPINVASSIIQ